MYDSLSWYSFYVNMYNVELFFCTDFFCFEWKAKKQSETDNKSDQEKINFCSTKDVLKLE